jgi:hypothetical protein
MIIIPTIFALGPFVVLFRLIFIMVKNRKQLADIHPYVSSSFLASFIARDHLPDFCGSGNDAFSAIIIPAWYTIFGIPAGLLISLAWWQWRTRHSQRKKQSSVENTDSAVQDVPKNIPHFPLLWAFALLILSAPSLALAYMHAEEPMYGSQNCGLVRLVNACLPKF